MAAWPMEHPRVEVLGDWLQKRQNRGPRELMHMFRSFNGYLEPFKQASETHERQIKSR